MKYKLISNLFCWIFVPLLIINPVISFSQTDITNHRKYWYYKSRLNNDFLKIGTGPGESMPFNQRGLFTTDYNGPNVQMNSGDGSSTLGYYIALLATEYYLLQDHNDKFYSETEVPSINQQNWKVSGHSTIPNMNFIYNGCFTGFHY